MSSSTSMSSPCATAITLPLDSSSPPPPSIVPGTTVSMEVVLVLTACLDVRCNVIRTRALTHAQQVAVTENFGHPLDFAHIKTSLQRKRQDVDLAAWEDAVRRRWPNVVKPAGSVG